MSDQKTSNYRERQRRDVEKAKDALLRAAASLTEWPIQKDSLPFAILETTIALAALVRADVGEVAAKTVLAHLARVREEG